MLFKILGPAEMFSRDQQHGATPSLPKVRQLLALLLSRYNQTVSTDSIIDELWPVDPPRTVMTTLQTYVYHLRKWLGRELPDGYGECRLMTRPKGYALVGYHNHVDAIVFEKLLKAGRGALTENNAREASGSLHDALSLWEGNPLANVVHGPLLDAYVVYLDEIKIEAMQLCILSDLELQRHHELVPMLRSAVSAYPLNEWFHGLLMYTLNNSGRRVEAFGVYRSLRSVLRTEIGVEPSTELQRLHQHIQTDDGRVNTMLTRLVADNWGVVGRC